MPSKNNHYQILIIGGGTGGIWTAAKILKEKPHVKVGIIEPSSYHYYQPAWTLVGGGTYNMEDSRREMAAVIPPRADWIQDKAVKLNPDSNTVVTENRGTYSYDYLVVAVGVAYDNSLIEGLQEAFDKGVACSNYINPEYTWECIKKFEGGTALFTQPTTPIKCGGAPQKIAYLMSDYLNKTNQSNRSTVVYATPGSVILGVEEVAKTLMKVIERYDIQFGTFYAPVKIDTNKKIAYFKDITPEGQIKRELNFKKIKAISNEEGLLGIPFDFLHIAPPQVAPKVVSTSKLANLEGWLDVHSNSLQHHSYKNVFGVGDVAGIPNAKSGSAIKKEVPVVVDNIFKLMAGNPADNMDYNGYSACPLVTAYDKMVLAEFDYNNNFTPDPELRKMLVFNSSKEHWRLWLLKKYGLPYLYWNKMIRGEEL